MGKTEAESKFNSLQVIGINELVNVLVRFLNNLSVRESCVSNIEAFWGIRDV